MAGKRNVSRLRKALNKNNTSDNLKKAAQSVERAARSAAASASVSRGANAIRRTGQSTGSRYAGSGSSSGNYVRNSRVQSNRRQEDKKKERKQTTTKAVMERYQNRTISQGRNNKSAAAKAQYRQNDNTLTKKQKQTLKKNKARYDKGLGGISEGVAKRYGGSLISGAADTVEDVTNYLSRSMPALKTGTSAAKALYDNTVGRADKKLSTKNLEKKLEKTGGKLQKSGQKNIDKAKEGRSKAAQWGIDLGTAATEMGLDALLTRGRGTMGAMYARSYGSAKQSALDEGASEEQARNYGRAIGGLEAATEKMFSVAKPLKSLFGKGVADDVTETLLNKVVSKASTQAGKNAAYHGGKTLTAAITEGLEEMVSEGLDPVIANTIYANAIGKPHSTSAGDVLYAGSVGAAMGGILGGGGQIVEYGQGRRVQNVFGDDGVKTLAKAAAQVDDAAEAAKGAALNEMINRGDGIAAGQANELYRAVYNQEIKDLERGNLAARSADAIMQRENLISPIQVNEETGETVVGRNTVQAFNEQKEVATAAVNQLVAETDLQLPEMSTEQISSAVAAIQTGIGGIDEVNLFTVGNPEARTVYEAVTGKTLPETNQETREMLFEEIGKNRVNSARLETEKTVDAVKGLVAQDMSQYYEAAGQEAFAQAFSDVNVGNAAQVAESLETFDDFYRAGRNGIAYADVISAANPAHGNVSADIRQAAWQAGQQDAFLAADTARGLQMRIGETARRARSQRRSGGRLYSDISKENRSRFAASQQSMYRMLARTFGIDIHVVDSLESGANGEYHDGVIYLSMSSDRALEYVFAHEITHHMQNYAPEEYNQLKEFVRTRWAQQGGIDDAIDTKIAQYAQHDAKLTREQALDEIIADSTYEMIQDEEFIDEVSKTHRNIAQALLGAIKEVLKKLRLMIAGGDRFAPAQNEALLSELDILKEFEKMWTDGLMRAAENRAAVGSVGTEARQQARQRVQPFDITRSEILQNMKTVTDMSPVVTLDGSGFEKQEGRPLSQAVMDYYGGKEFYVNNSTLGEVKVGKRGIKSGVQHKLYGSKIDGFKGLREVISNGKIINVTENYSGNENDRVMIAAPIMIGDEEYYMGVVVNRNLPKNVQNYYLHDVIWVEKNSLATKDTGIQKDSERIGKPVSPYTILQQLNNINNLSEKDVISDEGRFSFPDESDVIDYANEHETEFVDVPPVRDYEKKQRAVRQQTYGELLAQVEKLRRDKHLTKSKVLDEKSVREEMNNLISTLMTYSESYTVNGGRRKTNHELVRDGVHAASQIYTAMKNGDVYEAITTAELAAEDIVGRLELVNDEMFHEYKELRNYLKNTRIVISEEDAANIPDFKNFKKQQAGRIRIVKQNGMPVDTVYQELVEQYPELFDAELTHPADQLTEIAEVRESLEPYDIMLSAEETQQLVKQTAQDLLDIAGRGKPYRSTVDKYDEKLRLVKARQQEAIRDVRRNERERAERLVQAEREKRAEQVKHAKERADKRVQAERDKARARDEKRRDTQARREAMASIEQNRRWLQDRIAKPTDDKHVPEGMKSALADLLSQMDMQTTRSKNLEAKRGERARRWVEMDELRSRLAEIAKEDGSGEFEYDGYIFEVIDSMAQHMDGRAIDESSTEQLHELDILMKYIVANIRNYNKAFDESIKEEISQLGDESIGKARARQEKLKDDKYHDRSGVLGSADRLLNESMVTPRDFFERLGGGLEKTFMSMRRGMDKHIDNISRTRDFFDELFKPYRNKTAIRKRSKPGSELEHWRDDSQVQTFDVQGGKISLSPAQIMSLYCLSKREQALGHIYGDGIASTKIDVSSKIKKALGAKIDGGGPKVMVSPEDVTRIINTLTPEQREMADRMQDYLNNECAAWGNEVSIKMFGYKKFTEKNYFPIKSIDTYLDRDFEGRQAVERIKNFGFTKGTIANPGNAIAVDDIFSVVSDHINKMSLYNAFAAPMSDFMRVYNYKKRNEEGKAVASVSESLESAYGKKAINYINNFMSDLNSQVQTRSEGLTRFVSKSLANYKKAAIGGNLRVAVQQPTAVMRAFTLISPRYFVNAHINPVKNMKDMQEHCQIAKWKAWGFNQVDMARDIDDIMMNNEWSKIDAVTMEIYGALDNVTWSSIWAAVREETKAKHADVKVDSEEFYHICNERASEIFDKTQVVDSVFHRSQAMRNTDVMSKMLTSFMSEPTRTYNMMRTEYARAVELWHEGNKTAAIGKLNRATSVFVLNAAAVSAAAAIADALRDKAPGDDDDDSWWANFLANFWGNVNPLNMIPMVKDIWGYTDGWGTQNMAMEGWEKLVQGAMNLAKNRDAESIKTFAEGLGYVTGLPVKNVLREVDSIFKALGINAFAAEEGGEDSVKKEKSSFFDSIFGKMRIKDGSGFDEVLNHFGFNLTKEEKEAAEYEDKLASIREKTEGLSGKEKKEKIWSEATRGYTTYIEDGDMDKLAEMRRLLDDLGGDTKTFDERVTSRVKTALKKNIGEGGDTDKVWEYRNYLMQQGMTDAEISMDIITKSDTAKEFQVSLCMDDEEAAVTALSHLLEAGITYQDAYTLFVNRTKAIKGADYSTGELAYPTDGTITSAFGYRNSPTAGASSYHEGIDIGAPLGSDVAAADGGKVSRAGWNGGKGYSVTIDHGNGRYTEYNHLNCYYVQKGDAVSKGQIIAAVGSTGVSTGPHLDFRVRESGTYVDPMIYFR
ncbi:peptidoglycan DD-metalloendopeptidase family protein [Gallibacter sp. Marseille-QA0791]|uniref:peptidoglycan DD-metalloendopeptidase family protein n=1 Tax=Gallibacter sp. Marseille-QA0791 TaxID=3378781 RepID=UPI003D0B6B90